MENLALPEICESFGFVKHRFAYISRKVEIQKEKKPFCQEEKREVLQNGN